jgi:hypothetical protein
MADIIFPDQGSAVVGATTLPASFDLVFWKGDYQDFIVEFLDELGAPAPITGQVPLAVMRASYTAPTTYEFVTTVQNQNQVRVYLPSSISKTIPAGDYIWNLQLTAPNGDVRTHLAGDVKVYAEVDA